MLIKRKGNVKTTTSETTQNESDVDRLCSQQGPGVGDVSTTMVTSMTAATSENSFIKTRLSSGDSFSSACSSRDLSDLDSDPPTSIQPQDDMKKKGHVKGYFMVEGLPLGRKGGGLEKQEQDDSGSATSREGDDNSGSRYGFSNRWITVGTFAVVGIAGMLFAFVLGEMFGERRATLAQQNNHRTRSMYPLEMERRYRVS